MTLSGFVSVFFEKVLKSRVVNLSVWDRNFQVGNPGNHCGPAYNHYRIPNHQHVKCLRDAGGWDLNFYFVVISLSWKLR